VQAPGEAQPVVRQELSGKAVAGGGGLEAGPGGLPGWTGTGLGRQEEPGVVVQSVDHPGLGAIGKLDPGGVDLPQVVGDLALETLPGSRSPPGVVSHHMVAPEGQVDGGDGRRLDPCSTELRTDPSGSPPGVILSQTADLRLEVDVDLSG